MNPELNAAIAQAVFAAQSAATNPKGPKRQVPISTIFKWWLFVAGAIYTLDLVL